MHMPTRLSLSLALVASSAAILLTSSALADVSAAHSGALSPPVIHESFTPLPCAGAPKDRTTLQREGCAEQQILRSDRTIDALNRSIFTRLSAASSRRDFVAGHTAWFTYRRRYCLSVSDVFAGGSEAGVLYADCAARLNAQHVTNLRQFLADLRPS
jgi:uncharacterized protein YecT (DUF1311 family)